MKRIKKIPAHPKAGQEARATLELAAIGIEAEFQLALNGQLTDVEALFSDPRSFIRGSLMHRIGTSYHLPTGGAVYFDTGVVEIATPVIEIERGCAARAGRSLWESILYVRAEMDEWERNTGNSTRLTGFSTHYNVSFELNSHQQGKNKTLEKLAVLLCHILPVPVMILAANRRSTGVGVRPRGDRIEITVDFTPSSSLMIATGTLITGIVREVMRWPSFELQALRRRGLPVLQGFKPIPHTTRKGWLANIDSYPQNPFRADIDAPDWKLQTDIAGKRATGKNPAGETKHSLRQVGYRIFRYFWRPVARISDPFTYRLIASVLQGHAPSLLDLPDRPPEYNDVGRLCRWENLFPEKVMARSRYERVLIRAISGRKLRIGGGGYTPTGMRGWSRVVFRRDADGTRHIFSIDYLLNHLQDWERGE
jgi:hypothetical protein